jgi:two-component system response regulator DesR
MAVLSEPIDDAGSRNGALSIVVSASALEVRRRIAGALTDSGVQPAIDVTSPLEFFDEDLDGATIVILACDVDLPSDLTGLRRVCRELPRSSIVAVSSPTSGAGVRRALDAGAAAIVFEPDLESTLAVTVRAVASGQSVVPRKVRASVERPVLSHRERQVLAAVADGFTNAQIAEQLYLSESTIKSHLSSAFTKLGVRSRREAAAVFFDLEQTSGSESRARQPAVRSHRREGIH